MSCVIDPVDVSKEKNSHFIKRGVSLTKKNTRLSHASKGTPEPETFNENVVWVDWSVDSILMYLVYPASNVFKGMIPVTMQRSKGCTGICVCTVSHSETWRNRSLRTMPEQAIHHGSLGCIEMVFSCKNIDGHTIQWRNKSKNCYDYTQSSDWCTAFVTNTDIQNIQNTNIVFFLLNIYRQTGKHKQTTKKNNTCFNVFIWPLNIKSANE